LKGFPKSLVSDIPYTALLSLVFSTHKEEKKGGERKAIERQATEGEVNSEDKTHNDLRY
jgi:hypothetical protein